MKVLGYRAHAIIIQAYAMPSHNHADMLQTQRHQWKEVIDISDKLLNCAQRGDWQQVDAMSLQRETMLEIFFRQGVAEEMIEAVQNGIEAIRKSDEEIVRLVKKNRGELAEEISKLANRKKHIQDYISNSR